MTSLRNLIQSASIPELKDLLRLFESRCPRSHTFSQEFQGSVSIEERGTRKFLSGMVEGICERFEECKEAADELLNVDSDEFPRRSWVLDGNEKESESENENVKRKKGKRKRDLLSSPLKPKARKKVKSTVQAEPGVLLPSTIPSWWPDISVIQNESKTSSSSPAPASASKRKRTIDEIFEADRQRRELEALQEAERQRREREIQATCAQCKAFFLTDDN
jgi:hypothetical protein